MTRRSTFCPRRAVTLLIAAGPLFGSTPAFARTQATPGPPPAQAPSVEARFEALFQKLQAASNEFWAGFQSETDSDKRRALYERRPGLEFLAEFKALAVEAKGTETSAKCWMQVATIAADFEKGSDLVTAIDTLVGDHVGSKAIGELPMMIGQLDSMLGQDRVEKSLQTLLDKSPHKEVRAGALFALAQFWMSREDPALTAKARACFTRLASEFGPLGSPHGKTYQAVTESFLFELDHLQVGQVAPDFEAVDENGVKFKLSDYRGKVVVIDFWGYW